MCLLCVSPLLGMYHILCTKDGAHITQIGQGHCECASKHGLKALELKVSSSASPLSGPGSADPAVSICSQSCDAEVRD